MEYCLYRAYAVAQFDFGWGSLGYSIDLILVLGSTYPLTEINARGISWGGKVDRCIFMWQVSRNSGGLNLLWPLGPVLACVGVLYLVCFYRYGSGAKRFVLIPQK